MITQGFLCVHFLRENQNKKDILSKWAQYKLREKALSGCLHCVSLQDRTTRWFFSCLSSAQSRVKPVCCKSTRPAHSGNSRHTAILASPPNKPKSGYRLSPARLPAVQTTPDPRKEEELNLTETPGSTTSTNTEKDSTFSFDVDDSDCSSSTSSSSSSLPSPEIFRRESSSVLTAHALTFSMKEEEEQQQGPHLHIKNSTLLDVSHAEAIHIHDPPDLSVIIGKCEKIISCCVVRNYLMLHYT